jgi:hypothetical protein
MHPRHKLAYFSAAGWSSDWIKVAEALVHEEFERYTAIEANDKDLDSTNEGNAVTIENVSPSITLNVK